VSVDNEYIRNLATTEDETSAEARTVMDLLNQIHDGQVSECPTNF